MMNSPPFSMPSDPLLLREAAERIEAEMRRRRSTNRLKDYRPYPKQREFHAAGKFAHERLFMAGNQLGKTLAGAAEWAMHLTGRYPDWWEGKVFDRPPRLWAAGINGKALREGAQKALIGPPEDEGQWGTGWIPKDCLLSTARARGQVDVLDHVQVRWGGGGDFGTDTAYCGFKTYEEGRLAWQGPTLDGVWFDEEPTLDIYSEGLTRTQARGLFAMITFTPLLGMSEVVASFLLEGRGETSCDT
jgi:phage terminase large subunit-like protein